MDLKRERHGIRVMALMPGNFVKKIKFFIEKSLRNFFEKMLRNFLGKNVAV